MPLRFVSPIPPHEPLTETDDGDLVTSDGTRFSVDAGIIDFLGGAPTDVATASHYAKQWGPSLGYTSFIRSNPSAVGVTMARKLGWPALFDEIRSVSRARETAVYDAACGFGSIFADLFADPKPPLLTYLGCDIHTALGTIPRLGVPLSRARFARWDISRRPPVDGQFDFVLCRAAIHHTPDPEQTFRELASTLRVGATIAISAYARKAPIREASDDALRSRIVPMPPDQAYATCREFSLLGKALQETVGKVILRQDLPFLGINAGEYSIHELVYDHFVKCWYNADFGDYSDVVNFDWYHPPYAFRYEVSELIQWYREAGLEVTEVMSHKAQHFVRGRKM